MSAHADPALFWPDNCDYYWDIGDLSEAYQMKGVGIACFNTLLTGPNAVQGGAADDIHILIDNMSNRGGSFTVGTGGHDIAITHNGQTIPQTLGTGNLAGESFPFESGMSLVELTNHDGIDRRLPIKNNNPLVNICVFFSDAGVVLPGQDPCEPNIGDPPFMNPLQDIPPIDPRFQIFASNAPDHQGIDIEIGFVPEPGSLALVCAALAAAAAHKRRHWAYWVPKIRSPASPRPGRM